MSSKGAWEERALQLRGRAKKLRAIAEGMTDETTKKTLFKAAADYERLALRAE